MSKWNSAILAIDNALEAWENVRQEHNLSDDMVAYGRRLLAQAGLIKEDEYE